MKVQTNRQSIQAAWSAHNQKALVIFSQEVLAKDYLQIAHGNMGPSAYRLCSGSEIPTDPFCHNLPRSSFSNCKRRGQKKKNQSREQYLQLQSLVNGQPPSRVPLIIHTLWTIFIPSIPKARGADIHGAHK